MAAASPVRVSSRSRSRSIWARREASCSIAACGLRGPGVEPLALHRQALQDGAGDGGFLARGRQRLGRLLVPGGGGAGLALRRADGGEGRGERRLGGLAPILGLAPAAPEQESLGFAQGAADLAVAGGGAGLAGERGELLRQLLDHVVDAGEVRLRPPELELGLVPALVEAGDAGRLLEDAAAGCRLGVDQLGNLALPHQRRRVRAGRGVGEQHLDVARPHVAAVGLVGRARVAGDAAHDVQRVGLVEALRCGAVGIVDAERHLGEAARGAGGGAGEDHVLHPVAAHRGRAGFAHDPAQGLEKVGLSAAVRTDHAGQPVHDRQVGRVDEALEPGEAEAAEAHGHPCVVVPRPSRGGAVVSR